MLNTNTRLTPDRHDLTPPPRRRRPQHGLAADLATALAQLATGPGLRRLADEFPRLVREGRGDGR